VLINKNVLDFQYECSVPALAANSPGPRLKRSTSGPDINVAPGRAIDRSASMRAGKREDMDDLLSSPKHSLHEVKTFYFYLFYVVAIIPHVFVYSWEVLDYN